MITVLSEADLSGIALEDDAVRQAVGAGLRAQAEGRALAEPTTVFNPVPGRDDLIAVIRGALPEAGLALVKTVGGFPGNAAKGLATNPGCLTLIETETGQVTGILPAATITTQRTAMVTAIGAQHLARDWARILGCIGTRGVAAQAVRYIARAMPLEEIRLHGRDAEQTAAAATAMAAELDQKVIPAPDWETCLAGADIMIDGAALPHDQVLFPPDAVKEGALIIAYGAYSTLHPDFMDQVDRLVMDRWVADERGALGPLATNSSVTEARIDAFIGDVIAGHTRPRRAETDRILFCHRGVAACDLALAGAYIRAASQRGLGTQVPL
ncbi:MAG: hypothetical protein AAF415_08205 [Pseudomonadota bacterium]